MNNTNTTTNTTTTNTTTTNTTTTSANASANAAAAAVEAAVLVAVAKPARARGLARVFGRGALPGAPARQVEDVSSSTLRRWRRMGLVEEAGGRLRLTKAGYYAM